VFPANSRSFPLNSNHYLVITEPHGHPSPCHFLLFMADQPVSHSPVTFTQQYLEETQKVVAGLSAAAIEKVVDELAGVRERGGRLFILGVGGSAANASHAVNDFRKICGFEAYAPTDNVSELTARTNDEGWAA